MMKKIRPLLLIVVLIPLVAFMFYPMAKMSPQDIHVGIVNLDQGADFKQGSVNLGNKMVKKIKDQQDDSSSDDESPVVWEEYKSKSDARKAMDQGDIDAFLVIPKNFSEKQTSSFDAFNNLSDALGTVASGMDKMSSKVTTMSSNFGKMPTAFENLSTATGNLGTLAGGLGTAAGMVTTESTEIATATANINNNDVLVQQYISQAEEALAQETPDVETAQACLEQAAAVSNTDQTQTISQNTVAISAQSGQMSQGLTALQTAENTMSTKFATMADTMGSAGTGVKALGKALGKVGTGLDTMSNKLDDKVGTAIDTMNSTEDEGDDTDEDSDDDSSKSSTVSLQFYIDQGNNILLSNTLSSMVNAMSANTGVKIKTHYINEISDGMDSMYFVMAFMMMAMFASMIPAMLTGMSTRPRGFVKVSERLKIVVQQVLLAAVIAAAVGCIVPRVVGWMCEADTIPVDQLSPIIGIFSFGILMLAIGAFDLIGTPAVIFPAGIMVCGTAVANLPYEYLPAFWQKYVYPWEPLRLLTDGIREIAYRGGDWWNPYTQGLCWVIIIGAAFMLLSFAKSVKKPKEKGEEIIGDAVLS